MVGLGQIFRVERSDILMTEHSIFTIRLPGVVSMDAAILNLEKSHSSSRAISGDLDIQVWSPLKTVPEDILVVDFPFCLNMMGQKDVKNTR